MDNNSQSENIEEIQDLNVSKEEGTGPCGMYILFKIYFLCLSIINFQIMKVSLNLVQASQEHHQLQQILMVLQGSGQKVSLNLV